MAQRLNSPDAPEVLHFVTLNVRDRMKAFRNAEYATLVLRELRFECDRHPACLTAFVVMPDHLHFLFGPRDGQVTRFLARFKPGVTLKMDALALRNGHLARSEWLTEKGARELWHDGKHSLPIYSREWARQKINYIHLNPVRAGLVERPEDWAFSSYGAYFPEAGVEPLVRVDVVEF